MASGHVNRAHRGRTRGRTDQYCTREESPCQLGAVAALRNLVVIGRVEMWRSGFRLNISVSASFVLAVPKWFSPDSVSTSRSSNRTCRFPASGSRTRLHAFTHGTSCPSAVRRVRA